MEKSPEAIQGVVKARYTEVVEQYDDGNLDGSTSLLKEQELHALSRRVGYTEQDIEQMSEAGFGLGCGNPLALQQIQRGDVVLDLGCGAGFDCFLAAEKTGVSGQVIGVDMTQAMIDKAKQNAQVRKLHQVNFRVGQIEDLPVGDDSVNVIISNCVINLSVDKQQVFNEAFRVLKPGGMLAISDLALNMELPDTVKNNEALYSSCISGAINKYAYIDLIAKAGFTDIVLESEVDAISLVPEDILPKLLEQFHLDDTEMAEITPNMVVSVCLSAVKPNPEE